MHIELPSDASATVVSYLHAELCIQLVRILVEAPRIRFNYIFLFSKYWGLSWKDWLGLYAMIGPAWIRFWGTPPGLLLSITFDFFVPRITQYFC